MTTARTPEELTILPRDLHFDVAIARSGHWLDGDPVATAVMNALSLTFPDGERLFMDAVRGYKDQLTGRLAQAAKDFIAQEAIHSREHMMLNRMIDPDRYPVDTIQAEIRRRIAFARSRGPMGMLISTICLEHFTAMLADMFAQHDDMFRKTDPALRDLWRWHAMEETEHKAVAYDVFLVASKDWPAWRRYVRRCVAMLLISYFFPRNITAYAASMLVADGYTPQAATRAVKRFLWRDPAFFGRGWRIWITWFKPGFHPWDHDNRSRLAQWQAEFNQVAAE